MQLQSLVFISYTFLQGHLMFKSNPDFVILTLQSAYRNIQSKVERDSRIE